MVPRRARFIWHAGQDDQLPPAPLRAWLDDAVGDQAAATVLLIPDRGAAWADAPVPGRSHRWAAALVTSRLELGTAARAASLGADDVLVVGEGDAMLGARLRRLADTANLRRETQRRRRVAAQYQPSPSNALRRRADRPAPTRPAILFVGPAGGDQLQAVNALGGWHVAAYAETFGHAVRHLVGGEYRAVVISGVSDPAALGALFGVIADQTTKATPSLVLLRPEAADYSAGQAIAAGADDVIAPTDPQDLIHQRLTRAIDDASRRAELRLYEGFEGAVDPVSGLLGYSAFHAYVARRLAEKDMPGSALLAIELAGVDRVNAQHGFVAGDRALAGAGTALASRLRAEDLLGRIGGAAFGVWVDHVGTDELTALTQRLGEVIRRAPLSDDAEPLTARIGWTVPRADTRDALALSDDARAQARHHALRAVG